MKIHCNSKRRDRLMKRGYLASAIILMLAVVIFSAYVVSNENGDATIEGDSALVGRWVANKDDTSGFPPTMDLLKDGTGIANHGSNGLGLGITWRVENGRFYMFRSATTWAAVCDYKISGTTLTLSAESGDSRTYTKQR